MRTFLLSLCLAGACSGVVKAEVVPPIVAEKCSGCHPVPRATSMPRHAWPRVGNAMIGLMNQSNFPINRQTMDEIVAYYTTNSPTVLEQIPDDFSDTLLSFRQRSVGSITTVERPEVTGVHLLDLDGDGKSLDLIVTDNSLSAISWIEFGDGIASERTIAKVPAPVNVDALDFDNDGDLDLAVSCMGEMHPVDKLVGEFHLLVNNGNGNFEQRRLLKGVARITDCAPADFDGDGDLDFVLAMFGWRFTGAIGFLEQTAPDEFELREILKINGCMQVEINDHDGDELPDFVALINQQHESIVQFTNKGGGNFDSSHITRANHPAFGTSSLHLHDLDEDGDTDILFTNGDMMDVNPEPKPYHGARWLENDGTGHYTLHYLTGMPGCYDAVPVDMDGDGDLDVVVSSLHFLWKLHDFPSLVWLENKGGFRDFVRRRIAYSPTNLAKIVVGDIDGNGKPDIVGGGMHVPGPLDRKGRLTVWFQE